MRIELTGVSTYRGPQALILGACLMILTASAAAAPNASDKPMPDYDAAGGIVLSHAGRTAPTPEKQNALAVLEQNTGAKVQISWNALSHAPRGIVSDRPLSAPSSLPPESIARGFIRTNKAIYGFTDSEVDSLEVSSQYTDAHNGVTHVYYRQMADGIPVFPANLSVHLTPRGEVFNVQGDVFPGFQAGKAAALTFERAAEFAAQHVGVDYQAARVGGKGNRITLAQGAFREPVEVSQCVYALLGAPKLAYRMLLHKNGVEWYDIIIDANSGQILNRRNLFLNSGLLSPSAPVEANPATPRCLAYDEHPLSTVRGTGDLSRKYPYTCDPTGKPRGFANAPLYGADTNAVTTYGGEPQISQTLLPMPNQSNPTRSNSLPLSTSPQSPLGWFTLQGGHYMTIGNNVDAKDDAANDDEATIGFRPDGGLNGDFSGPAFVYQNHYAQNGPYADNASRYPGAAPDLPAVVTNLFFLCNFYHDLTYHLGFTEAAGNFQQDNFGKGGIGGDYVFADAQDGSGVDNSNFGTPPDGSHPRMQMFIFTGRLRDGSMDADVVFHEHTHGLSNRLVGGPADTSCLGLGLVGEAGGMGEGWGDWMAAMITDEPCEGEYVFNNTSAGIRRQCMNAGPSDFTYGFICSGPPSNPSTVPCEVHDIGEFWSIVLWEMREAMINRFHNRAFPGGPAFPTSTGPGSTGTAGGNIRNAQGRTTDGSGNVGQTDYATIENATFKAMFDVVDGMKQTPCSPTMIDARNGILASDRAAGGEFVDLIWRAFGNRGVGNMAFSSGGGNQGGAAAVVEDFSVPTTVSDCETAGGPLPAASFTAISNAPNSVDITITANGAAQYAIYRGLNGGGTTINPTAFTLINTTSQATYTDTGLDGGRTYTYRVRAQRNADCVSPSNAVDVLVQGGLLPCTTAPTFGGLTRVINPGNCQSLKLDWTTATANCPGGQSISYNIYRGTSATFTPGAANRIAAGVIGNSYSDTVTPGTLYYYAVRAEDSTTGHGGPANGGNEDTNAIHRTGMVTSAELTAQGYSDDMETGPDNQSSTHFKSSGFTASAIPTRGGWFRESNPGLVNPHSGTQLFHTYDPDNKSVGPDGQTVYELRSDIITITPVTILTWYQAFFTEAAFDGGVVEAALVDNAGTVGTFQDIGNLIYENGYNGVLDASGSDNTLANRAAYTGGNGLGDMTRTRAFIGGLVPTGNTSQKIVVHFLFGSDVANSITVPPGTNGNYYPGWYIDDVSLEQSCCPISAAPTGLDASASGNNQITLTWAAPGGTITNYLILRELIGDQVPSVFVHQIASVPGTQLTYVDNSASGGLTFAYVVRAIPASGCPSGDSNVATATAFGTCAVKPTFNGVKQISAPAQATCSLFVTWDEGATNCPGNDVRYNVYRSTNSSFTPGPTNKIALGLSGASFLDQSGLTSGTTYYYVVRAEDTTSGNSGPANGGNEDTNVNRKSGVPHGLLVAGPNFNDNVESTIPGYTTFTTRTAGGWSQMVDGTAHSPTHSWVALDDQPGAPATTQNDGRLMLPPVNLTSTSVLTFWHNYDFARFPSVPMVRPNASYASGGVLEISADGLNWFDLRPHITIGGYTGTVDSGATCPLAGRRAWVGSSDSGPDNPAAGRTDSMTQVTVNLGATIQDPDFFGVSSLPAARIRFRLGGTYQILIGGIQGSGWGVDDIVITNVQQALPCNSCASCVGDLNGDGKIDGKDVSTFVNCVLSGGCATSACADMTGDGTVDINDMSPFIAKLLNDADNACP